MKAEPSDDVVITVTTEKEPSLAAVAQFLTGVVIMRESLLVGTSDIRRARFEARLSGLTTPLLIAPAPIVESCGVAWSMLGDWPPMDKIFRGGVIQGLLEASEANAPRLGTISSGSIVCTIRRWLESDELEPKFARSMVDSKLLLRRSQRGEFKDRMLATLGSGSEHVPASPLLQMLQPRRPEMLAAGAMMFACQSLESAYLAMGARDVTVKGAKPNVPPDTGSTQGH